MSAKYQKRKLPASLADGPGALSAAGLYIPQVQQSPWALPRTAAPLCDPTNLRYSWSRTAQ